MKNTVYLLGLLFVGLLFVQCDSFNNKSKLEQAEAEAKTAQARLDSIEQEVKLAAANKLKAEEELKAGKKMPSVSVKEVGKVNPVDEGQLRRDFNSFRNDLINAISRKDVTFIMNMLDENVLYNYDETPGKGKEGFKKFWKLDKSSATSKLWQELNKVVQNGGTFDNKDQSVFTAPYVFTTFPSGYDTNEYAAVTGKGVRMREKASRGSKNIASLSYDVVRLLPDRSPRSERIGKVRYFWRKVQLEDGTEGYVYGQFVHGPADYRASFERADGSWKMFMFVKGEEKELVEQSEAGETTTDSLEN